MLGKVLVGGEEGIDGRLLLPPASSCRWRPCLLLELDFGGVGVQLLKYIYKFFF